MINDPGEPSETHLYTDFAMAGQDAFALVACMGTL
jgi:hypothetical protein